MLAYSTVDSGLTYIGYSGYWAKYVESKYERLKSTLSPLWALAAFHPEDLLVTVP